MNAAVKHGLIAFGAASIVLLADIAQINPSAYVQAGCSFGIAFLGGLGIGVAKRAQP